jgi:nucleoside-diphosphate-sugar epimerase
MVKYTLVTGGTGFIGTHLVKALLKDNRAVRVLALENTPEKIERETEATLREMGAQIIHGDLYDRESLIPAVENVDVVYHLGSVSRPKRIPLGEYYDVNILGTRNLLQSIAQNNLKRFIHVSTVSVLGLSPDGKPIAEDDYQYSSLEYGTTKRESEQIAIIFGYRHKVPVVVIRPSLVYGPGSLVRKIMFSCVKYGIFPLFSQGKAEMEFLYVENLIQALLLAEKKEEAIGETFNITDGCSYKISLVIETMAKALNVNCKGRPMPIALGVLAGIVIETLGKIIGFHPPFSRSAVDWMSKNRNVYSCEKAKLILGYNPSIDLPEGIRRTVSWYKERGLL